MNRDRFEGGVRNLRGRAKTAMGAVGGDAGRQLDGAVDQAAGVAQNAYGRARETARDWRRDGEHFIDEASERGRAIADEAVSRGRHYRGRAEHHGRHVAKRAEENQGATLAIVAAAAFGLGWLLRSDR
ncbi:CsbD family protein [Methylobacterium sp. E-025]|uniref:CsbD family protein n=1 Tax=Methylobacterium sp. E-025 TaxID=2836561 RepID=UPI001FB9827B|nr:CsbD family protein [Methylobacterium sp. E-025]MCJ2113194.1 CsbD family protein [Methylobacterium sp. E-025]